MKIVLILAAPLIAFLSLIVWMGVMMSTNRCMNVNLKFIGLALSVSARSASTERRGASIARPSCEVETINRGANE